MGGHAGHRLGQTQPGVVSCVEEASDCIEKKCARAASRVKEALVERISEDLGNDSVSQPVRRVVLAEQLSCLGGNDGLVEHLEDVMFDLRPVEASEATRKRGYIG